MFRQYIRVHLCICRSPSKTRVKKLPSFVEDTPHFLIEIEQRNALGPLPPESVPVSIDVVALYPNVAWKEGLQALGAAAEDREDKTVPTDFLLRLMLLVLATNTFEFNSNLYLQKYGTAIGTRSAPTFATYSWAGGKNSFCKTGQARSWSCAGGSLMIFYDLCRTGGGTERTDKVC